MNALDLQQWSGRSVLVTGDTGFKGAWLCEWLLGLGADVTGIGLEPATTPSLFEILRLGHRIDHRTIDVCDRTELRLAVRELRPQAVFHLAAQSLVRRSYREPLRTLETNVLGTANLLDAIADAGYRAADPCAVVVVTSDKCYAANSDGSPCREDQPMGGQDLYSASKGMVELLVTAWRQSFCSRDGAVRLATARAGNVLGGGDWATDRIAVDCVQAIGRGEVLSVRQPHAVRPWQHVLEPLSGYLQLGACLRAAPGSCESGWNFGPGAAGERTVAELCDALIAAFGQGSWQHDPRGAPAETAALRLSIDKSKRLLGWRPVWEFDAMVAHVVEWYRAGIACGHDHVEMTALTQAQIAAFRAAAVSGCELVGSRSGA